MSLMRDMSYGELMHMRKDGMSNQEIAKVLDVSYQTVLRQIGKQPSGMRKAYSRNIPAPVNSAPIIETVAKTDANIPEACLAVVGRSVYLMGNAAEYSIDCSSDSVNIKIGEGSVVVPLQKMESLMKELAAIMRNVSRVKVGNEMW